MITHDMEQRGDDWFKARHGLPTASQFGRLLTAKTRKPSAGLVGYACQLAAERYAGDRLNTWGGNMDVSRGRILEDDAAAWYEFERGVTIQKVGFITDETGSYGCSPDGLVNDDGLVEIKCLNAENHVKALLEIKQENKCPDDYFAQVQGETLITGREWCDMIFYHHHLPPVTYRVTPDREYHAALLPAIHQCIEKRDEILKILRGG